MSFEVKLKRLSHRNWIDIVSAWQQHIASLTITHPGQQPEEALSDFYLLEDIASSVPKDGEYRCDIPGLRSAMLHEGIYLIHKAANVLVASQSQVTGGLPTWSIATAYQSAFFSMEAMLLILGIAIIEVNNKTLVLDVWPEVESSLSKKLKAQYKMGSEIQFIHHARLEHHHRWAILKRVLRTFVNSPIDGLVVNAIDQIDDKDFARQRNKLHYSNVWYFDDLHTFLSPLSFCRFQTAPSLINRLDADHPDFSVVLATMLLSNAASLLSTLGKVSPLIAAEWDLLNAACGVERMTLRADYEQAMHITMI